MKKLLALCALTASICAFSGDDKKPLGAEARTREFESLQKELEVLRPDDKPSREQVMAFLEAMMEKMGKFAKANPQTPEGFEAAANTAAMLFQVKHPKFVEFAELAVKTAPAAGVEVKNVGMCWAMVAQGRLNNNDSKGAAEAIEKIKPLNPELHTQMLSMMKEAEEIAASQKEAKDRLQVGKEPFPIAGKDIEGKDVSLAGFKGKVVIIDFWATWCGPCMGELPNLLKSYEKHHAEGLEVLGISLDQDENTLKATVKKRNMTWPILADYKGWENVIAQKWGVRSIPATFLLDKKGVIREIGLRGKELDDAIVKLLKE
jgi:peroxiredoxin